MIGLVDAEKLKPGDLVVSGNLEIVSTWHKPGTLVLSRFTFCCGRAVIQGVKYKGQIQPGEVGYSARGTSPWLNHPSLWSSWCSLLWLLDPLLILAVSM